MAMWNNQMVISFFIPTNLAKPLQCYKPSLTIGGTNLPVPVISCNHDMVLPTTRSADPDLWGSVWIPCFSACSEWAAQTRDRKVDDLRNGMAAGSIFFSGSLFKPQISRCTNHISGLFFSQRSSVHLSQCWFHGELDANHAMGRSLLVHGSININ